jgi:hypothetical protein
MERNSNDEMTLLGNGLGREIGKVCFFWFFVLLLEIGLDFEYNNTSSHSFV